MTFLGVILMVMLGSNCYAEDYHTRYYNNMILVSYVEVPNCDYPSAKVCFGSVDEDDHFNHCIIIQDDRCPNGK